jgi:methyl-accepting chemotaxis protein
MIYCRGNCRAIRASLQMRAGLRDIRLAEYRIATAQTSAEIQDADSQSEARIATYGRAVADYEKLITEPEEKVEEAAAASSLESQANDLKASVSMFRLNASREAAVSRPVAQTLKAAPAHTRAPATAALKRPAPQPVRIAQTAEAGEWDRF